ncbi:MAG: PAS domain S-box protein, partial [Sphingobacteriia bacterium]|nr:PAS domain S-box protein [Sphingobacteriia bacterium]
GFFGKQALKAGVRREAAVLAGEATAKTGFSKAVAATPAKIIGTATAGEATIGVGQNVLQQRMGQETQKALGQEVEDLSASQMAVAAIFSTAFGYAGAKGTMKQYGKSGADELDDLMKKAKTEAAVTNPAAPITPLERRLADPVAAQMNLEAEEFMKKEGARILNEVSPATPLMDAKIANDMSARAVRVARHIIENDASFQLGPNEKISTAISNVFSKLDSGEINDAVLEQAINAAGLTPREFAQANKLTVTEAASIMQQYSVASRAMNKLKEIDPEFKKLADELFGAGKLSAGVCISNLLAADEKADYDRTLNERIAQKSDLFSIEFKLERNGQTFVIEQRTKLIHENGLPIRLVATARDITESVVNRK